MVVDVMLNKVFTESEDNTVLQESACSLCKSASLIADTESGEVICSICGMVVSDKIRERRPESRRFLNSAEVSNERSGRGMPTSLAFSDMRLSTVIGNTDRDASGYKIEPSVLSTMHRLRTWDFRTQVRTSADRNFRLAFTKLDMLKDKLGLSDAIIEKAAYIYRKAQQRNLARGRSVSIILTAATYIACREAGIPKTLKEIAFANNINRKLVAKASELGVKPPTSDPMKCRKMTSDHIHASFHLEPIKRNFHLYALVNIIHVPSRHSAFFIRHCLTCHHSTLLFSSPLLILRVR